ncbi:MAG: hypothetical protein ABIP51_18525 [Bacteroidia bacterium]
MLSKLEQFNELMKDTEFHDWYESRPESIKSMVKELPYTLYEVLPGSPYGISAPGTKVFLNSYRESGMVTVVVTAENLTKEGKEHIKILCDKFSKNYEELITKNHSVEINPVYLKPIE